MRRLRPVLVACLLVAGCEDVTASPDGSTLDLEIGDTLVRPVETIEE